MRSHIPDRLHRRMHMLMLQRENTGKGFHGGKALEQFALHQPESFQQFMRDYEKTHQFVEANMYATRNTYSWAGAMFDTCSKVLQQSPVAVDKELSTRDIKSIEEFYKNPAIKTFFTMAPNTIRQLEQKVRQQYHNVESILHKVPANVVNGDNELYWKNDNKLANIAHYGKRWLFNGRNGYKRWLAK